MKLHEYQAKEMLAKYGVPVNEGQTADTPDEAEEIARRIGRPVMIKAQVMMGGRGKAGGVKYSKDVEAARKNAENILGKLLQNEQNPKGEVVKRVLVADAADIKKEYYLGATVDRASRLIIVMGSAEGGVEIEEVAKANPDAIIKVYVDPRMGLLDYQARDLAFGMGLGEHLRDFGKIARGLVQTLIDHDASLVEINPLAITGENKLVALDAKMAIDDNALYKQKWAEEMRDPAEEEESERQAREAGISFVKLDGNIGCMVNGAGLAMATMDTIKEYGGTPANFLDIGGGAREDKVRGRPQGYRGEGDEENHQASEATEEGVDGMGEETCTVCYLCWFGKTKIGPGERPPCVSVPEKGSIGRHAGSLGSITHRRTNWSASSSLAARMCWRRRR